MTAPARDDWKAKVTATRSSNLESMTSSDSNPVSQEQELETVEDHNKLSLSNFREAVDRET